MAEPTACISPKLGKGDNCHSGHHRRWQLGFAVRSALAGRRGWLMVTAHKAAGGSRSWAGGCVEPVEGHAGNY